MSEAQQSAKTARLLSLDVFRGITIAGMLLVNNPGSWSHIYAPLRHAEWHGCTPTDLIFPFFLFIVGVAMVMSLSKRLVRGDSQRKLFAQVVRRTLIIFGLGLLLHGFPYYDLSAIRIPGVLQRIALCYFFAASIVLKTNLKGQITAVVVLLLVYWALMKLVPVPGYGAGVLEKEGNLAAYIDNALLHGHLWQPTWDPEGLLSTLPAIATTLLGVLTGQWLQTKRGQYEIVSGLMVTGCLALALGWLWNAWLPINKNLWTSSYSVYTAGTALCFLGVCYYLIDVKGYTGWTKPFVVYGMNAITVFVLSGIVGRLLILWKIGATPAKTWIYQNLFASWAGPLNGSLIFAMSYVLFWLGMMWILYWRRIFIKI
ncbi:MAG: acyltransferase family protein [bacterium]